MKRFLSGLFTGLLLSVLLYSHTASAAQLIIDGPNGPDVGGDCLFSCAIRYQQVYDSVLFGNAPVTITGIEFLHTEAPATWAAGNQYTVRIGYPVNGLYGVDGLGAAFADNFASSQVFAVTSFSGEQAPWTWFGFAGSFVYNPLLGDLLIDIQRTAGAASLVYVQYAAQSRGEFSRVYDFYDTVYGQVRFFHGDVTRFTSAATVPEPTVCVLLAAGLFALALAARRRVRRA